MIYTVTLNPAVDYFITLQDKLMVDEVNRGSQEVFKAGGKGLNVSIVLSLLHVPSRAVALLGGFTGQFIVETMRAVPDVTLVNVPVNGMNRINLKAHYDHKALCINGQGPQVREEECQKLLEILGSTGNEDVVVISGSMMRGLDETFLVKLARAVHAGGARLVIDMEQIHAEALRQCEPDLIKPNLYELRKILDDGTINVGNVEVALKKAEATGIRSILVSLGKDGAVLRRRGRTLWLEQPHETLINKVGAGDAMLAAFLGKLTTGSTEEEALAYGGAAGNAVASKLENITEADIEEWLPKMHVRG
jgi:1-phosphofructokinase